MSRIIFSSQKITQHVTRILDGSDVCEYLIEGNEKALLIDTGYGIGDLKGFIDTLTKKPYEVYMTHAHVDHGGGAYAFGKVHLHHRDQELFKTSCSLKMRIDMVKNHVGLKINHEDFLPVKSVTFEDIEDDEVVDLGGYHVKFVHTPGHTQGIMVPIFIEDRIAMFGDACGVGSLLLLKESGTVEQYLDSLKKLQKHEEEYDKVLRQHGTMESTKQVLEDNIENCKDILAGTDDHVRDEFLGYECWWAKRIDPLTGKRADGREGNIRYAADHIR